VISATTIQALVDSVNVKLSECRKAPTAVNVPLMTAEIAVVAKAAELVAQGIDAEMRSVGMGAQITAEERQQITAFRETLKATRDAELNRGANPR
jgi:hypothetical protein